MFTHPCRHRRRRRPPSLVSTTIPPQHCLLCDSLGLRKEVVSGGFGLRNLKLSSDNAMVIWSQLKGKTTQFKNPSSIGQAIAKNLPESEMIESTSVAGPGFVNIKFSNKWYTVWHVNRVFV
ncbi:arginine--tRNA ligase, cytoplasmic-like isoform X2 [Zingiber officinale]|uniref:arginine--tRNA ligase, cytoplasmic-like isoform X2 n=1 Tax=Zingiber officinale TaxID=94328 RepID=UPI001C4ACD43|nr:arginine--tRNA ligase, cytoplasmic-like isoform X2 [Zingiber officinale]